MRSRIFFGLALLAASGAAGASENFYKLYDLDAHKLDGKAREAVARLQTECAYSEFSRIGPRPEELRRCNAAEKKAVSLGADAARAALALIDGENTNPSVRWRLYDVIARAGDLAFVEPLVAGLEREERRGLGNARHYERPAIVRALEALTYVELKGTPAIQWRAWADAHRGLTRDQLFAERLERARDQVAHAPVDEAAAAAHFLAMNGATRREGRSALEALRARRELTQAQRALIDSLIGQIPQGPAELAAGPVPSA